MSQKVSKQLTSSRRYQEYDESLTRNKRDASVVDMTSRPTGEYRRTRRTFVVGEGIFQLLPAARTIVQSGGYSSHWRAVVCRPSSPTAVGVRGEKFRGTAAVRQRVPVLTTIKEDCLSSNTRVLSKQQY